MSYLHRGLQGFGTHQGAMVVWTTSSPRRVVGSGSVSRAIYAWNWRLDWPVEREGTGFSRREAIEQMLDVVADHLQESEAEARQ